MKMLKIAIFSFMVSGCVTIIKNQCAEDVFLDDEVLFREWEEVSVSFEERFSFYEKSCLPRARVLDIAGWEKGVLYYNVEISCLNRQGTNYLYRPFKIPQRLLHKVQK